MFTQDHQPEPKAPEMERIQPTLLVPQSSWQPTVTLDMGMTQGKDAGDPKPHTSPEEQEWGHGAFHLRIP